MAEREGFYMEGECEDHRARVLIRELNQKVEKIAFLLSTYAKISHLLFLAFPFVRMMVEEEQISFRSDSLMVDGVEDYSHQIAEMIGLRNESNFNEAGVCLNFSYDID